MAGPPFCISSNIPCIILTDPTRGNPDLRGNASHGRKKRPEPAWIPVFYEEEIRSLRRDYIDAASTAIKQHGSAFEGEEREVAAETDIASRQIFAAALTDKNVAGEHFLTAEFFHAETFADAIASILDAALSFFMGHMRECGG